MEQLNFYFSIIGKSLSIIGLIVYSLFSLLVVRQVAMMTKVIHSPFSWLLRLLSWVHFAFAIILVLLAFVIL